MAHFRDFSMFACPATDDLLRPRIDHMIDLRHPLAVLASRMPWQEIEARGAHRINRGHLKGERGDRGYNIKWLLRMTVRKSFIFLAVIFLRLQQARSQALSWLGSDMAQPLRTAKSWISAPPHPRTPDIRRWPAFDALAC